MSKKICFLLVILNSLPFYVFSQVQPHNKYNQKDSIVVEVIKGDSILSTSKISTKPNVEVNSENKYIVEFDTPPLNLKQIVKTKNLTPLNQINQIHDRFKKDLSALISKNSKNTKQKGNYIKRDFKIALNGVAIEGTQSNVIDEIRKLPYVKKVHIDYKCKIVDNESDEIIKADEVWSNLCITGKGIVIAIIDTGIDSTHQELKGKVIGGYDFVNNDDNPIDDHGHGTHCAGIAAANGPNLKGVAPDAKLMAVKVLNSDGSGYNSWIISGIEYALNPDNNPLTDDGADVISMSLGSSGGSPDDALSTAVNNSYKNGVLCVVAAGNNGNQYFNVSSPGSAKDALTVGASDKYDNIAGFSSWGPISQTYTVKPEVVAPGVGIYSSTPNNNYASWDGTSMATPHVAGAAALLLQLNHNYSPEILKSLLVNSARTINSNIWAQGNGCINVLKAALLKTTVSPSIISLGLVDNQADTWSKVDTITLHNLSNISKNYKLEIEQSFPSGITSYLSKTQALVSSTDTAKIIFRVSVNKDVPIPEEEIPAYKGFIKIYNDVDTIKIPFVFLKGKFLKINYDFVPQIVLVHNNNNITKILYPTSTTSSLLLPNGVYDIITYYSETYFIREGVDNTTHSEVNISIKDAKNLATFQGKDPNGNNVQTADLSNTFFVNKTSRIGLKLARFLLGYTTTTKKYLSDISENYVFEISPSAFPSFTDNYNWYSFPFSVSNLKSSKTYEIDPLKYRKILFNYSNIKNRGDSLFYTKGAWTLGVSGYYDMLDYNSVTSHYIQPSLIQSIYIQPTPTEDFIVERIKTQKIYSKPVFTNGGFNSSASISIHQLPYYYISPEVNKFIITKSFWNKDLIFPIKNKQIEIPIGCSPINFLSTNYVQNYTYYYWKTYPSLRFSIYDYPIVKIPFTISTEQNTVLADTLVNDETYSYEWIKVPLENKIHYFRLQYDKYWVKGLQGLFSVEEKFTPANFMYLPYLAKFELLSDSLPNNILSGKSKNFLTFNFNNGFDTAKVKLQYKKIDKSTWNNLKIQVDQDNYNFHADIPDTLSKGYYSLRYYYEYDGNNYIEQKQEPAFYVTSEIESDSLALVDLFNYTNGKDWLNNNGWLKSTNIGNWFGVKVENNHVTEINLPANNLKGSIPQSIEKISSLKKLIINNNRIDKLPDISKNHLMGELKVQYNSLTFTDIIPNLKIQSFTYSPQDSIETAKKINLEEGENLLLQSIYSDTSYHYKWFKNDSKIDEFTDSIVCKKANLQIQDSGSYYYKVSTDSIPGFELVSHKNILQVNKKIFEKQDTILLFASGNPNGGSWVDFDNDGDDDLFITSSNFKNRLYQNMLKEENKLYFKDITDSKFAFNSLNTTGCTWGDFNKDGLIDVFVSKRQENNVLYKNSNATTFDKTGDYDFNTRTQWDAGNASWVDFNNDGNLDLFLPHGASNSELYKNNGDLTFTKAFENRLPSNMIMTSSLWSDINNDNWPDLIINNCIVKNNGSDVDYINLYTIQNNFPNAFSTADYDNDGDLDIFATIEDYSGKKSYPGLLFENINNQYFTNQSDSAIADYKTNSYGSSWGDYDNDGDIDLFVCYGENNNVLWKNLLQEKGIKGFEKLSYGSFGEHWGLSTGCANSDFNNDGFLDLFIANLNPWSGDNSGKNILLKNIGNSNKWIKIKCVGTMSNTSAIGIKVKVKSKINGKDVWQLREIQSQTGFASQNSFNVHFGLGNATKIDSLKICWSSGYEWDTTNVQTNQFIKIVEKKRYNTTFYVNDGLTGLANASIKLNGNQTKYTNIDGYATFSDLIPNDSISYTVILDNFFEKKGSISVKNSDVIENVILAKIGVSVDSQVTSDYKLYPNITDDIFRVTGPEYFKVSIFDITGSKVYETSSLQKESIINISTKTSGIYFVKIENKDYIIVKKIIKR
ncbi:MAG: S8 family serine peptidase [Bacteroidales bacterium]|nr:S8 family serine peptidase [Bacteroidales bacterium]